MAEPVDVIEQGTLSADRFIALYPEFRTAPPPLIERALFDASKALHAPTFGAEYSRAVGLYAAHIVALSHFGQNARLKKDSNATTYSVQLDEMTLSVTACLRPVVTGRRY